MTSDLPFIYPPGEESFHRVVLYYIRVFGQKNAFLGEDDAKILGVKGRKEAKRQARIAVGSHLRAKRYHRTPVVCRETVRGNIARLLEKKHGAFSSAAWMDRAVELEKTCYNLCQGQCEFPALRYATVLKCILKRAACVLSGGDAELVLAMRYGARESHQAVNVWLRSKTKEIAKGGEIEFSSMLQMAGDHDRRVCQLCGTWQSGNGTTNNAAYECWNCGCKNHKNKNHIYMNTNSRLA